MGDGNSISPTRCAVFALLGTNGYVLVGVLGTGKITLITLLERGFSSFFFFLWNKYLPCAFLIIPENSFLARGWMALSVVFVEYCCPPAVL